jgi:NAD(P)-dependent dehydrogenase (short-subunit alcohol dehydrogenase family)
VDLGEEQQCHALLDRVVREFGRIDVLVSNAAYQMSQDGGLDAISSDQFDRVMQTNVYGLFWLCTAAVPHMRPARPSSPSSSVQALQPSPHLMTTPRPRRHRQLHQIARPAARRSRYPGQTPSRLARCGPR